MSGNDPTAVPHDDPGAEPFGEEDPQALGGRGSELSLHGPLNQSHANRLRRTEEGISEQVTKWNWIFFAWSR